MAKFKLVIAIFIILVVGCSNTIIGETVKQPIKVGGLFAMTGFGAEWGMDEAKAAQLAFDEEPDFELIIEDIQSSGTKTITAAQKLIQVDKVKALVGPTWDEPSLPLAPVIENYKILTISPCATEAVEKENDYKYFFSSWYPDRVETRAIQEYSIKQNITKYAIIYNKNIYAEGMRNIFIEEADKNRIKVIQEFALADDALDFRTILLQLNPEVQGIYIAFTALESYGPFLKQTKDLGIEIPIFGSSTSESSTLINNYGKYADGLTYAYPKITEKQTEFRNKFKSKYGKYPTGPSAPNAYDAAKIVIEALKHENPGDYIETAEHDTISFGKVKFSKTGIIDASTVIYEIKTIKNGEFVIVENNNT